MSNDTLGIAQSIPILEMSSLQGIFVPTIAPYNASGGLAESELRRIVNWLIDKGVSGSTPTVAWANLSA
jgi:hypothetical protein